MTLHRSSEYKCKRVRIHNSGKESGTTMIGPTFTNVVKEPCALIKICKILDVLGKIGLVHSTKGSVLISVGFDL